jgi:hypothetical protein
LDLLQSIKHPETGQDFEDPGISESFFVLEGQSQVFEETECCVQNLRVVGIGEDGDEGFVHLACVYEFFASVVGTGEVSKHDAGADLELKLGT